jgi:hypothetical protein
MNELSEPVHPGPHFVKGKIGRQSFGLHLDELFFQQGRILAEDHRLRRKIREQRDLCFRFFLNSFFHLFLPQHIGDKTHSMKIADGTLGQYFEFADGFDCVPPELDADGMFADEREDIKDAAADGEIAV